MPRRCRARSQERAELGSSRHARRRVLDFRVQAGQDAGAQEHLNAAQRALSRLADELNDVQGFSGIGPDVGDFLLAADWLFDNVFMDAMVQQRIVESRERVAQAIAQCEDVRDQLLALRRPNRGAGNGLPGAE